MSGENQCITVATDDTICELIRIANDRLVVLAPALHAMVAQALVAQWAKLGADRVSVILDLDAEVFRLGYGDPVDPRAPRDADAPMFCNEVPIRAAQG